MRLKIRKSVILQYFLIYWMLLDAGAAAVSVMSSDVYYLSLLGLGVGICILKKNTEQFKNAFKSAFQIFCLILLGLYALTFVLSFGGLYYTIILSNIGRIAIVVAAVIIDSENFTSRFIRTVSVLATMSLIIFLGYFIAGTGFWSPIASHLPVARKSALPLGAQYGMFFLCFNYFDPSRNSYIFGEPGEYQLVISTALFLLLFVKSKLSDKEIKCYLLILLITMVTIQSTTGYISLAVLLICALLNNDKIAEVNTALIKKFLFAVAIVAIIGIAFFDGWNDFINKVLTEKIVSETGNVDLTQGTASARWNGFVRLGKYIKNHPLSCICGIGYEARIKSGVTSCNGFANSVLDYGILTILWVVYNYFKSLMRYSNIYATVAGTFVIMNTWFGQPVTLYTLIIVIAFTPMLICNRTSGMQEYVEGHK